MEEPEEVGEPEGESRPRLGEFMERSFLRLLLESVTGAVVGSLLSGVLRPDAPNPGAFTLAGAILAPVALLLTPVEGSVAYRGLRYGAALAVLATLVVSFAGGADGVRVDELIAFGLLLFGIGAVGHGVMVRTWP